MAVKDMSKRDRTKLRVLLDQLEISSEEFTTTGFIKMKPCFILSFLSLGIEYFIFLYQNLSYLRQVAGIDKVSAQTTANASDYNETP